ncbi:MAG TPA: glycosyltransferase [Kofleriaceae bacterium]|nr:glycosyltransferase [Kofleriaceae bacterium]
MRILFLSYTGMVGHTYPMVAVIEHLLAAGHEVAWCCRQKPDGTLDLVPAGATPIVLREVIRFPTDPAGWERTLREPARLADLWRLMSGSYPEQVAQLREVIRSYRPDVLAVDASLPETAVAARLEKLPSAAICGGLAILTPPSFKDPLALHEPELERQIMASIRDRFGVDVELRGMQAISPHVNVAFTTEALYPGAPPDILLAGPSIPRRPRDDSSQHFPWHRLRGDRPIVYASTGTIITDATLLRRLAAACAELGAQLVLSTTRVHDEAFLRELPGDVIAAAFVPQVELLARISAFVTHGGGNSVMESLYHGVPMLIVPYFADQFFQAYVMERAGSEAPGVTARPDRIGELDLRATLAALLDPEGSVRRNARRVQASYRQRDGGRLCAERIMALA